MHSAHAVCKSDPLFGVNLLIPFSFLLCSLLLLFLFYKLYFESFLLLLLFFFLFFV